MTCLHLAAKCGSVDTVKYLVEMTDTEVNIKVGGPPEPISAFQRKQTNNRLYVQQAYDLESRNVMFDGV